MGAGVHPLIDTMSVVSVARESIVDVLVTSLRIIEQMMTLGSCDRRRLVPFFRRIEHMVTL